MEAAGGICIIAVGDELLEGRTVDTNSRRLQRALGGHGLAARLVQAVPDRLEDIGQALQRTRPGDLVVLTGGLGSTPDDVTRQGVAAWAGVALVDEPRALELVRARFRNLGREPRPEVLRQGQVPEGMVPVPNPVGSAPGLVGRLRQRWLVLLPGFPAEVEGLLPGVVDELRGRGALPPVSGTLVRRCAQVTELDVVRRCRPLAESHPELVWSWWVTDWGVDVRVRGQDGQDIPAPVPAELDLALGEVVFSRDERDLPQVVQDLMLAQGVTCGTAESCTAGLLGGALTAHGGSSGFFRGGILAYADQVKNRLLGVPADILAAAGAVSEPVVRAMAEGCRQRLDCSLAVAVSGISGPGGGTPDKPVGTTWMAVAAEGAGGARVWSHVYRFPADRRRNRLLTVAAALDSLRRLLEWGPERGPWDVSCAWEVQP